ncbi:MAG: hypothetical protein O2856_11100 [Planctomycetota bacterium]|nr:hypothetical protein [Planctomycetota bacterium]
METAKRMNLSQLSVRLRTTGGQGVHREVESEGFEEKYRAVIKGAIPTMNRSAKGEARSSLHYGDEGVSHSLTAPRCLRSARYGRFMRDPRRAPPVFDWHRSKQPYKQMAKWEATPSESSDNSIVLQAR